MLLWASRRALYAVRIEPMLRVATGVVAPPLAPLCKRTATCQMAVLEMSVRACCLARIACTTPRCTAPTWQRCLDGLTTH